MSSNSTAVEELKQLQDLVDGCGAISGSNERCTEFRKKGAGIKDLLLKIYDPYQKFHVTSKNLVKHEKNLKKKGKTPSEAVDAKTLGDLMDLLTHNTVSGHAALDTCLKFIQTHETYRDVILKALNKDLKIRVGVKMVNKAFPLLVPVFSCALSQPIEKHEKFYETKKNEFFLSRKLDGCRCQFRCENGNVVAYSRSGHVYPNHIQGMDYFVQKFKSLNGVLDGEMGVTDDEGKEYFNLANSIMNPNAKAERGKNNLQLQNGQHLCFFVFDFIPISTFKAGQGPPTWSERQANLKAAVEFDKYVRLVEQHPASEMENLWQQAQEKGWEGLMLRLDTPYEGKKTRNMLKRKRQDDDEFDILEATSSLQLVPGTTDQALALEHVRIEYKGCSVWVGSGWEWADRLKYGQHPEQLVGWHATVKHYGESRDREGNYSLRHPSVKQMWPEGRTH